ncbi:MAG: hypothetical protein KF878_29435 [Planctomycetes bacterium]|nr:hypothetical protein [Planctomycetota bacterium]
MRFRCTTCQEEKDASAFTAVFLKRKSKVCRDCKSEYNRRWYEENKAAQLENATRNNARYRKRNKDFVLSLKRRPCTDCGGTFHPTAMEFDHVRGEKVEIVAYLVARMSSLERIREEVAKCDLVCANCHRVRTAARIEEAGRRGYWQGRGEDEPGPRPGPDERA